MTRGARAGGRTRVPEPREAGVVVGRRAAAEAIRAGLAVEVLVAESAKASAALRDLLQAAEGYMVRVSRVPASTVEALAGGVRHQGVVARVRPLPTMDEGALARREWAPDAIVLVLDGVHDPQNVGAAARSAEAAGAEALVVRRRRGAGATPGAVRASAGALAHLPVAAVANISRAVGRLQEAGFWAVGLEGVAGRTIFEVDPPPGRLAVVVGSEERGLSRLVRQACDELASIPMRGRVESLNASAAAAVALYLLQSSRWRGAVR